MCTNAHSRYLKKKKQKKDIIYMRNQKERNQRRFYKVSTLPMSLQESLDFMTKIKILFYAISKSLFKTKREKKSLYTLFPNKIGDFYVRNYYFA